MSDTFRKAMLGRLPQLPPTRAPWADQSTEEDEMEELEEGDSMPELGQALPNLNRNAQNLTPLSASAYFAQALEVQPSGSDTVFRTYITPPANTSTDKGKGKGKDTYLIFHHGAGASGLSFALLGKYVGQAGKGDIGVLSYDCRGHGRTRTEGSDTKRREKDLSIKTLLNDLLGIVEHLFPLSAEAPALLLCGHSMGAAPILSAAPILQQKGYSVSGVIVLDVVEGTAVEALPLMKSILAQRPKSFKSVIDGINWHVNSHSIRNSESARISVPSFLKPASETTSSNPGEKQTWRTDLLATEPYWEEWYAGMSSRFLGAKCARLLVLAGSERLDRELMVGQMQGKFQLEVMPDVGHYLHEDDPQSLASTIVTFWRRNTQILVLPPKIGAGGPGIEVKRVGEI